MAGLGRGFGSLIPTDLVEEDFDVTEKEDSKETKLMEVKLSEISRFEDQPRKEFSEESIDELAASIKEHGVLQPIVVTKEKDGYKLVAGERRWRASKKAGLEKIPALVRTLDAQKRLELSIIENAQREDLNAIEFATAYAKLKSQFNLDTKQIAERVGKSETAIINTMRLLNLPESAKKAMLEHNLSEGVMRPLVSADEKLIEKILPQIIEEGWSARKVERYVAEHKVRSSAKLTKVRLYARQEDSLGEKYAARVRVHGRSVTFACKNEEELKKLLEKF